MSTPCDNLEILDTAYVLTMYLNLSLKKGMYQRTSY